MKRAVFFILLLLLPAMFISGCYQTGKVAGEAVKGAETGASNVKQGVEKGASDVKKGYEEGKSK